MVVNEQRTVPTNLEKLEVIRFGSGEFSSKLVTKVAFKANDVVASIENFERNVEKKWSTVQVAENEHIELDPNSGLVYMVGVFT
jgi:hypothetical protein